MRKRVGDDVIDVLLGTRILERAQVANRYPCEAGGGGCPRHVVKNTLGSPSHPWIAVCGRPIPACADIPLTAEGAEEYSLSQEQLARALRALMGLSGSLEFLDRRRYDDAVLLGELTVLGGARDVFLSITTWHGGLDALLAARAASQRASLIFVPAARALDPELAHRYTPGAHVTLAFLADVVRIHDGRLALARPLEELTRARFERAPQFCTLYEAGTWRPLSNEEYSATIARPTDYDLFLDGAVPRGKRFVGGKKTFDGSYEFVELSREQMLVMVELVARGTSTPAAQLASVRAAQIHDPLRIVQRARKLLDVKLGHRNRWRSFHVTPGVSSSQKSFVFRPPEGLRYAILAPPRE